MSQSILATMRRATLLLVLPCLSLLSNVPGMALAAAPNTPLTSCDTGRLCLHIQQVMPSSFNQILAYASATVDGQPLVGLAAQNVTATVDGQGSQLQEVTGVTDVSQPLYAAVLLDTSTTMGQDDKLPDAKTAIAAFGQSLNPQDQIALYQIAGDGPAGVHRLLPFTNDHTQLAATVNPLPAPGPGVKAPIYDALYQVAQDMAALPGRRLVVLQTDMHDDSSVHSLEQALTLLQQVHLPVYTIGLGKDADVATLQHVAQTTGGTEFTYTDAASLSASYQAILSQLRDAYRLTIQTPKALAVGSHTLQVQVAYQGQTYTDTASFVVPATKLTLHLSLPAGAQVTGQTSFTLDTQGDDLPIRSVVATLNGKALPVSSSGSRHQIGVDTRFMLPGMYQLRIVVTDIEGNQAVLSQPIQVSLDWAFWLMPLIGLILLVVVLVVSRYASYRFLGGSLEGVLTVRNAADQQAAVVLGQDVKGSRMRLKITKEGVVIGAFPPRRKVRFAGPAKPAKETAKATPDGAAIQAQVYVANVRVEDDAPRVRIQYFRHKGTQEPLELVDGQSKKVGSYRVEFSN